MNVYIAFLRAINVGGIAKIAMADLRTLLAELGFADPQTLLQTGNLLFRAGKSSADQLESKLQRAITDRLGLTTDVFVRTASEWSQALAANPFPGAAADDPSRLLIMPLNKSPTKAAVKELQAAVTGPETVAAVGRELFIVYPDGIGRSKLTNKLIESRLGARGTGRNWNTALKIAALIAK